MAILGIDYGNRRVGIATSTSRVLASTLTTIPNPGDFDALAEQIARIAAEHDAETLVLGRPARSGPGTMSERIEQFADALARHTHLEVVFWNEDFTSIEASENLRARGASRDRRGGTVDAEAARLILQSWLDAGRGGPA